MYKIFYISPVKKDLKALSQQVRKLVDEQFLILSNNPFIGKLLKAGFKNYLSHSFSYQSVEYRIIYQLFNDKLMILIIMIWSRENIYKRLKRRL